MLKRPLQDLGCYPGSVQTKVTKRPRLARHFQRLRFFVPKTRAGDSTENRTEIGGRFETAKLIRLTESNSTRGILLTQKYSRFRREKWLFVFMFMFVLVKVTNLCNCLPDCAFSWWGRQCPSESSDLDLLELDIITVGAKRITRWSFIKLANWSFLLYSWSIKFF